MLFRIQEIFHYFHMDFGQPFLMCIDKTSSKSSHASAWWAKQAFVHSCSKRWILEFKPPPRIEQIGGRVSTALSHFQGNNHIASHRHKGMRAQPLAPAYTMTSGY